MTDAPKHARFGASKSFIFLNCPGAIQLIESLPPEPPSRYADEGTRAHNLAAYCLEHDIWDAFEVVRNFADHRIENGPPEEEIRGAAAAVNVYLGTIASIMATDPEAKLLVETRVCYSSTYYQDAQGTADAIILLPTRRRLVVVDYKHGQGVPVDVIDNTQLWSYGLGGVLQSDQRLIDDIEIIIVQPRVRDASEDEYVKRQVIPRQTLLAWQDRLNAGISAALQPGAPRKPGEWCSKGFCRGRGSCLEYAEWSTEGVRRAVPTITVAAMTQDLKAKTLDVLPSPDMLTPEQKGAILDKAEAFKTWLKQVQESAFIDLLNGREVPGWKLVNEQSRRKWAADVQTIVTYLQMAYGLDEDTVYPRKLATITEVEAALKAALKDPKAFKEAKDDLTISFMGKESAGLTIVEASNRREAASPIDVKAMLTGVANPTALTKD